MARTTGGLWKGTGVVLSAVKATELGHQTYFLGLRIDRRGDTITISVGQQQYVATLLERFSLADANPARLPMSMGCKLRKEREALPEPFV